MRVWMKVFLMALILVVSAMSISSVVTVNNSRKLMLDQEMNDCMIEQERLIANIVNEVQIKKTSQNAILLKKEELSCLMKDCAVSASRQFQALAILDTEASCLYEDNIDLDSFHPLLEKTKEEKQDLFYIDSVKNMVILKSISYFHADGEEFILLTQQDLTSLYQSWKEQVNILQKRNFFVAMLVSLVLLAFVFELLSPLSGIQRGLREISKGNYQFRILEKGSYEFKELSRNINTLTQSVSENVDKIQAVSEGRKQFIDNFAHEMKTPLTSILGFSNLLCLTKEMTGEKRREYAGIIEQEAKRLKNLSAKLLELSTAEHIKLEFREVKVGELFGEIQAMMKPALSKKHCNLKIEQDDSMLYVDKELFQSLLYNLLDNAIKASYENGEILLACKKEENSVRILVSDQGIGMSKEEQKKVLEPFYMVDKSRSRRENGVGLGLTLCAEIVKQHNGKMKINSKKGEGTTVMVILNRRKENEGC